MSNQQEQQPPAWAQGLMGGSCGEPQKEDPDVLVGTLIGPHGQTVGRFVRFETYHNLKEEMECLRSKDGLLSTLRHCGISDE